MIKKTGTAICYKNKFRIKQDNFLRKKKGLLKTSIAEINRLAR